MEHFKVSSPGYRSVTIIWENLSVTFHRTVQKPVQVFCEKIQRHYVTWFKSDYIVYEFFPKDGSKPFTINFSISLNRGLIRFNSTFGYYQRNLEQSSGKYLIESEIPFT